MHPNTARTGRALLGVIVVVAAWETTSRSGLVDATYLPSPTLVAARLAHLLAESGFRAAVVSTLLSWALALMIAIAAGGGVGLLVGGVPGLGVLIGPVVEVLRPLPSVALIPLAVVVMGSGAQIKITMAVFAATWPILVTTVHALLTVDPVQADTAQIYRIPRIQALLGLTLPAIAPAVLTSIRLSASIALVVVVGTEFLAGGTIGLGEFAYVQGSSAGRMDLVLATTVLVALANGAVDTALLSWQRRAMPWSGRTDAR